MKATAFSGIVRVLLLVVAFAFAGCTSPPNETPVHDDAWTAFDSVGGFAGLGQRTVVLHDDRSIHLSFDPQSSGGITVADDLADWGEAITAWMTVSWGPIADAHVTSGTLFQWASTENLRADLDQMAAIAAAGQSDHTSQCADCFTHGFHHATPAHSSTAYGFAEEFEVPWQQWTTRMGEVQSFTIEHGTQLRDLAP